MKISFIRLSLLLAAIIPNTLSSNAQAIKGVYKTADDYTKGNLSTDYDGIAFKHSDNDRYFLEKGQEIKMETKFNIPTAANDAKGVKVKESAFYAYVDKDGVILRIVQRPKHRIQYLRILTSGKISFYVEDGSADFNTDAKGNVTSITWHTDNQSSYYDNNGKEKQGRYTEFPHIFYVASNPDGLPIGCDEDNLKQVMSDDADIVAKVKSAGIPGTKTKEWADAMANVMGWINTYNSKHK